MKPLRIALTGGRGRLAPYIAAHLRELDGKVVPFSRSTGDDFQDIALLTQPKTLADFDTVLHLGWSTVPLTSEQKPGSEQLTDLPLLHGILRACAALRWPPHFVFFSTAAVYGNTQVPATEETPCKPLGGYATAKLQAEEVIRSACRQNSALRCGILRVTNVFGLSTTSSKPQGILLRICRAIQDETSVPVWGTGDNTKDYLFLTDFLAGVEAVVTHHLCGTFNVASEKSLSVNEIISLVESFTGKTLKRAQCPAFSWDVQESHISAGKFRQATGWCARHDLAEAIKGLTESDLKCV